MFKIAGREFLAETTEMYICEVTSFRSNMDKVYISVVSESFCPAVRRM